MVRALMYVGLCVLLFAGGLGISIMTTGVPQPETADTEPTEDELDLSEIVPADPTAELKTSDDVEATVLPVPVRGEKLSVEELFRFGAMYREQQEALLRREQQVKKENVRLKLIQDDVVGARTEIDGLRSQVEDTATRVNEAFSKLQMERSQFEAKKQNAATELKSLDDAQESQDEEELANLQKISIWFQNMDSQKAAQYLRHLCNDGKIDSAVKLLGNIEERTAADILAAMEDPTLVVDLTEAFRRAKRPQPRTTRR